MLNCRSACNKVNNLREILRTISPSVTILSETWERKNQRLNDILNSKEFVIISNSREKTPGVGAAIILDKNRYKVIDQDIIVPEKIEAALFLL